MNSLSLFEVSRRSRSRPEKVASLFVCLSLFSCSNKRCFFLLLHFFSQEITKPLFWVFALREEKERRGQGEGKANLENQIRKKIKTQTKKRKLFSLPLTATATSSGSAIDPCPRPRKQGPWRSEGRPQPPIDFRD